MKQIAMNMIDNERALQDQRWGQQDHADERFAVILMEEVGEAAKELLQPTKGPELDYWGPESAHDLALLNEVVQCAAVCAAWAEAILRRLSSRAMVGEESGDRPHP